jgi:ubiquinol-cytochrome c reductase cytochrome b subunit
MPAEEPYITLAQIAGLFYFGYFLVILPVLSRLEY